MVSMATGFAEKLEMGHPLARSEIQAECVGSQEQSQDRPPGRNPS